MAECRAICTTERTADDERVEADVRHHDISAFRSFGLARPETDECLRPPKQDSYGTIVMRSSTCETPGAAQAARSAS